MGYITTSATFPYTVRWNILHFEGQRFLSSYIDHRNALINNISQSLL